MNFLHWEFDASANTIVVVTLDKQANVRLLDSHNFMNYHSEGDRTGHSPQPTRLGSPGKDVRTSTQSGRVRQSTSNGIKPVHKTRP